MPTLPVRRLTAVKVLAVAAATATVGAVAFASTVSGVPSPLGSASSTSVLAGTTGDAVALGGRGGSSEPLPTTAPAAPVPVAAHADQSSSSAARGTTSTHRSTSTHTTTSAGTVATISHPNHPSHPVLTVDQKLRLAWTCQSRLWAKSGSARSKKAYAALVAAAGGQDKVASYCAQLTIVLCGKWPPVMHLDAAHPHGANLDAGMPVRIVCPMVATARPLPIKPGIHPLPPIPADPPAQVQSTTRSGLATGAPPRAAA